MREPGLNIDDLITHVMPLEKINEASGLMTKRESIHGVVVYGCSPREARSFASTAQSASMRIPLSEVEAEMKFSVYVPPQGKSARPPVLYYLAGLTCTEETFMIKTGAMRLAAELGVILVAPDTSPRGLNLPGEDDSWYFGTGLVSISMPRPSPGGATTECILTWSRSCPRSSKQTFPARSDLWSFPARAKSIREWCRDLRRALR